MGIYLVVLSLLGTTSSMITERALPHQKKCFTVYMIAFRDEFLHNEVYIVLYFPCIIHWGSCIWCLGHHYIRRWDHS